MFCSLYSLLSLVSVSSQKHSFRMRSTSFSRVWLCFCLWFVSVALLQTSLSAHIWSISPSDSCMVIVNVSMYLNFYVSNRARVCCQNESPITLSFSTSVFSDLCSTPHLHLPSPSANTHTHTQPHVWTRQRVITAADGFRFLLRYAAMHSGVLSLLGPECASFSMCV